MKKILFPGSFDPITYGHLNLIKRLIKLGFFVEVGILNNRQKPNFFSEQQRLAIIEAIKENHHLENMDVFVADGMLVDICQQKNIEIVARGLRSVKDFEYEKEMEINNKLLNDKLEYLYINTHNDYMTVSSTVVRELIYYHADISHLVPQEVIDSINNN